ncbi:MAG: UTP--glucose-1-phosphate uridylyltransferase [Caldilineaceae bacterium]|nr:UTP--glucose-1-phosphate uridylyltransferase [Caldilineaceae bacterium]
MKARPQVMAARQQSASPQEAEAFAAEFVPFAQKMQEAGQPAAAVRAFYYYYQQLAHGATGHVSGQEAHPVTSLPVATELDDYVQAGEAALGRAVVIKLNGGLGTTMGMRGPKSLVQVKDGLTFLDIIARQVLYTRQHYGVRLPLVLMNSFNTQAESRAALRAYPTLLEQDVPVDFLQHQIPKIWKEDRTPVHWPAEPAKEWCPPGHGDIYLALQTSGMLAKLLEQGYEYALISNADNLGATVDVAILGYIAQKELPFLMEVAKRQPADSKGGHLAVHPKQGLILRELAQCPVEELHEFQDIDRYQYFNTNNLWIHLPTLQRMLAEHQGVLKLPLIRNEKAVDPTQPDSPKVYQLETAMGHAIGLFAQAQAMEIPRSRFLPVKNTNDLLALWSDAYLLADDYTIHVNPARQVAGALVVDLDKHYYGLFNQLKERFQFGAPSLVNCTQLHVEGDIYFAANVGLEGDIWLYNRKQVPFYLTNQ